MPIGPARMPFLQHLGELRRRLQWVVLALVVVSVALYFVSGPLFNVVLAPIRSSLPQKPVFFEPLGAFSVRFQLAFVAAFIACSPLIIWQSLAFMLPALKPTERRFVVPTFLVMVLLFLSGVAFCYFLILPFSYQWLATQGGGFIAYIPEAASTIKIVEFFLLAFGLAFQTPVVVFYLVFFGIVPYPKLRKSWRAVYLVIAALSAGITPDWSWVTMTSLFVAMTVLYEGCMLTCRLVLRSRIKAQGEKAALEAAEAAAESA